MADPLLPPQGDWGDYSIIFGGRQKEFKIEDLRFEISETTNPAIVMAGLTTDQKEEPAVKRRAKYILPALSLGL